MISSRWERPQLVVRVTLGATIVELPDVDYGSFRDIEIGLVERELVRVAAEPKPPRLIVDLSKVDFLGAKLIGVLVNTRHRLKAQNCRMWLCGLRPACTKLARILHMERLFEIFPTQRMALRAAMRSTPNEVSRRAAIPLRIAISDVAWDQDNVRLEYFTENDSTIYTRIVSRQQTAGIYG